MTMEPHAVSLCRCVASRNLTTYVRSPSLCHRCPSTALSTALVAQPRPTHCPTQAHDTPFPSLSIPSTSPFHLSPSPAKPSRLGQIRPKPREPFRHSPICLATSSYTLPRFHFALLPGLCGTTPSPRRSLRSCRKPSTWTAWHSPLRRRLVAL